MQTDQDNILIRKIAEGDISALDVLYIRFAPQVKAFLGKVVSSLRSEDIEDITQDIFLKIWESRSSLEEGKSLPAFVFTLAKNAAINEIKHSSVVRKHSSWERSRTGADVSDADPERDLETKESLRQTREVIENLAPQQKSIFLASRFEEKTYEEIARQQNLSPRTIQYHISEVLKKLRERKLQ